MSSRQHKTPSKDKAPALPDPQQGHISSPPPELKFFMFSDPAEARSASNKKLVRSHVARTSHAKSRRAQSDNVAASSSSQGGLEHVQYEYEAEAPENSMAGPLSSSSWDSSTSYQGSFTMPEPQFASAGYQSYGSQGPANYAPTQLSSDEQYLLDHYVGVYIPKRHNPCDHPKHSIDVGLYQHGMTVHWVNFCLMDSDLMQGIFHASCVDLAKIQRKSGNKRDTEMYEQRALHYRGECLRLASEAMPQDGQLMTDKVIAMTLFLACNEYAAGDYEQARQHMAACEYMIDLKGGHQTLGLDGFLSQLVTWSKEELCTTSANSGNGKSKGKKKAQK